MKLLIPILGIAALVGFAAPAVVPSGDSGAADPCLREDPTFVGSKACKACHLQQFTSWSKTEMAKAFDTLKPGQKEEQKKKFNLDPAKDYTTDATCLPCHTTGYGKPGGYPAVGKDWSDEEKKRAADLQGVGCESCHGAGSLSIPFKKANENYKREELVKLGLSTPDKDNCAACHNDKSPTLAKDVTVDFDALFKHEDKLHKKVPLKKQH